MNSVFYDGKTATPNKLHVELLSDKIIGRTASKEILSLLNKNTNRNVANIELRPKGIIVRFNSRLENYALVIPYFKLSLFKGEKDSSAVFCDQHKITFEVYNKQVSNFMKRLLSEKAKQIATN